MIETRLISSLEKVFLDEETKNFNEIKKISALRGEKLSLQLVYRYTDEGENLTRLPFYLKIDSELSNFINIYNLRQVPVIKPVFHFKTDDNYLRTAPGLFPDLLEPTNKDAEFYATHGISECIWLEIAIPEDTSLSGDIPLAISLLDEKGGLFSKSECHIEIIPFNLPEQKLIFTQWFYCDCLADYYRVPVWSDRHWQIIENYAKKAVELGINTLLTPVFTPPIDTKVGGERLTTQLTEIKKTGNEYFFSWTLLDKWIEMCNRVGIKKLEVSHLFTQWGATSAPKIMAEVDGEYKQIFGWDTDAHGEEYRYFIRQFLKAFLQHMKERGDEDRLFFHISDEPIEEQLPDYEKSKNIVADILEGYTIMDALSSYDFYEKGVVKTPIPANDHIKPFIENGVENLWTYYCCGQCLGVSNRLISMPSWRNRSIGMQMYKYNIVGFLHWGYNFYNSEYSLALINPYLDLSGEKWVPAGDPFSVYPAFDGTAMPSLRAIVFYEALQDMRAMALCESLYSHKEVVEALEKSLGYEISFDRCAVSSEEIHKAREVINSMIKAKGN